CIDAVNEEKVNIGVVPIENAIEGTVHLSIDYLVHQVRLPIVAELVVPIQQNLLVHSEFEGTLSDIAEVHSHRHAIALCQQFIHKNMRIASIHYANSTGKAAELFIANVNQISANGIILSDQVYNLIIFEDNIHDYSYYHTRFIVLTKDNEQVRINLPVALERRTLLVTLRED